MICITKWKWKNTKSANTARNRTVFAKKIKGDMKNVQIT
jgi:hypothetical protein